MFQLFLIVVLEFLENKQQARNWDKLRLAWDWDKSSVSISDVRLYIDYSRFNETLQRISAISAFVTFSPLKDGRVPISDTQP